MKKSKAIPIVIAIAVAFVSLALYGLHSTKMPHVTFSGNDIESDGNGPYDVEQIQGSYPLSLAYLIGNRFDQIYLTLDKQRFVSVRFADVDWKDEDLIDKPPRLSSKRYRMEIFIYDRDVLIFEENIGDHLETQISLHFYDWDTGEYVTQLDRGPPLPDRALSVPLEVLYNEGHAYLVRESEDVWVLDVNGWFRALIGDSNYYVRLSFRMTLAFKGLI